VSLWWHFGLRNDDFDFSNMNTKPNEGDEYMNIRLRLLHLAMLLLLPVAYSTAQPLASVALSASPQSGDKQDTGGEGGTSGVESVKADKAEKKAAKKQKKEKKEKEKKADMKKDDMKKDDKASPDNKPQ
jgi:hypothetical protein